MIRSMMLAAVMSVGFAVPAALADTNATTATTDGHFVNIRSGPGVNHPAICLAWPNVPFKVVKCEGNWCAVEYLRSKGWMSARHIAMN